MRSITIDAENEEDFNQEFDRTRKSRLCKLNFDLEDSKELSEDNEEDNDSVNISRKRSSLIKDSDLNDYEGLGAYQDEEDNDSDDLGVNSSENDKLIREENEILNNIENMEEKGIELLCLYLKKSVNARLNKNNFSKEEEKIFYRSENPLKAMSGNAISDLNFRELVDNIMNENENVNDNENNELGVNTGQNSLKEFISQNIESDATLKIMVMSNNKSTKNLFIKKLLDNKQTDTDKNREESNEEPFELRKKKIML